MNYNGIVVGMQKMLILMQVLMVLPRDYRMEKYLQR